MKYISNPTRGFSTASLIFGLVVIGLILLVGFGSCAVVPAGHRGVSVTLGKVDSVVLNEGITLKKPFIEDVIPISVRQESVKRETVCFTSDLQTIHIQYTCLYRLPEQRVVELYQQYSGDLFQSLIEPRYQESLKQITALYTAEDAVKKREDIKQHALEKVRKELNGLVTIIDIPLTNIDLTDQLEKAIEQKQVMQQQALAKHYELEKEQKEAEITKVKANAEASAITIKAAALKAAPEVITLEIVKRWDGKSPQTVVVGDGGANVLLPLK